MNTIGTKLITTTATATWMPAICTPGSQPGPGCEPGKG